MCAGFQILLPKPVAATELVATVAALAKLARREAGRTLNDGGRRRGTLEIGHDQIGGGGKVTGRIHNATPRPVRSLLAFRSSATVSSKSLPVAVADALCGVGSILLERPAARRERAEDATSRTRRTIPGIVRFGANGGFRL